MPGLHEYPDDFLALWKYILRNEFRSAGRHIIVAECPSPNGYDIAGFAVWERSRTLDNKGDLFGSREVKNSAYICPNPHFEV
jgi:hypothetical protein